MTPIPHAGPRPIFLAWVAHFITALCAIFVLTHLTEVRHRDEVFLVCALWAVTAFPGYIIAIVLHRRRSAFGEMSAAIQPSPLVIGRGFEGWIEVDGRIAIVGKRVQLFYDGDEAADWLSPDLSGSVQAAGAGRQRVMFKGAVPADAKKGLLSWRIRAEVKTSRGSTRGSFEVNVVP